MTVLPLDIVWFHPSAMQNMQAIVLNSFIFGRVCYTLSMPGGGGEKVVYFCILQRKWWRSRVGLQRNKNQYSIQRIIRRTAQFIKPFNGSAIVVMAPWFASRLMDWSKSFPVPICQFAKVFGESCMVDGESTSHSSRVDGVGWWMVMSLRRIVAVWWMVVVDGGESTPHSGCVVNGGGWWWVHAA